MTSLPKRGDRVRVTWAHQHSSLKVGSEVVLSSRGYSVDPANELYRPTPPPDCVAFMYADADHRERGSHAVKVEILERAGATCPCGKPGTVAAKVWSPSANEHVPRSVCDECAAKCVYPLVHPEFARGMRRAVEIAGRLRALEGYGLSRFVDLEELKEAVEKELK